MPNELKIWRRMDMGDGQRSLDDISKGSGSMLGFRCIEEEQFVGEGEVGINPTSAKVEAGHIINRIIFQKDLLEMLFELYDGKECGQVRCSKLLELVKVTMCGDYEELEMMLDPMGCDMPVDLETFRSVMLSWEGRHINAPYASGICTDYSPLSSPRDSEQRHGLDVFDMSFPNSDTSPDASPKFIPMDPEGMESEIAQLRFENKKLAKEKENLEIQVLKLESRSARQQKDIQTSQNRIQSLQNGLQEREDDFYKAVSKAEETESAFRRDQLHLKAEKNNLEQQLKLLKVELKETITDMLSLRSSEENFRIICEEQQIFVSEATNRAQQSDEKLSQKTEECSQFRERLLEILRTNEQLRCELREREEEVMKLHEALFEKEVSKFGVVSSNADNDNDTTPQLDVTMDKTFYASTPLAVYHAGNSSIYSELMDSLSDESYSQPICGKVPETDDVFEHSGVEDPEADILTSLLRAFSTVNAKLERVNAELLEKHPLQEGTYVAFEFGKMAPKEAETQPSSAQQHPESVDLTTKLSSAQLHDIWAVGLADLDGTSDTSNPESQRVFLTSGSTESLKDQISKEVKMLRLQVAKSQAILSSLQAKGHKLALSSASTSSGKKRPVSHSHHSSIEHPNTLLDYDVTLAEFSPEISLQMMSQQSSFLYRQAKMLNRFYTLAPTSGSQSSTPMHIRRRTKSCPILPSQTATVTKATQTEPMDTTAMLLGAHQPGVCPATDSCLTNSPRKRAGLDPLPVTSSTSALRTTMSASVAPSALAAMAELEPSDEESSSSPLVILRNRTYSFSQAIQSAGQEDSPELPQRHAHVPVPSPLSVSHQPESNNCQNGDDTVSTKVEMHDNGTQATLLENNEDYRELEQGDTIYHEVVSTKKKPLGELHLDRQKKTGMVTSPKDYQLPEGSGSKCDPDEDSDEDDRRIHSRGSSRRRRRSFGSPASSPAIQRSKAIDFEFEEESEAQQAQLLSQKPLPKKDDSDVDVKRDILEGMSQAASRAASELASSPPTATRSPDAREPKLRRRPGESGKSRLLMPELMENSETESAKGSGGSMESEADPTTLTTSPAGGEGAKTSSSSSPAAVVAPPAPTGDGPFPSLPDSFLKKLGLHKDNKDRTEHLSEGEVDTKFNSLCLAFKTDRFTLGSRLELHQRQRDLAEKNIDDEIVALKENLNALSQICADEETRELVKRLHHHLDVLHQSTARMSSRAEVYGAVQQEERTSRAIEVMLMYVENAKRLNEKTLQELEDMKRIVIDNNLLTEESSEADDGRRTHRTFSMSSVGVGKPGSRRRASIAALPRSATERLDSRPKGANIMLNSRNSVCNIGSRRCPVQYNLRPFPTVDQMSPSEKVRKHSVDVSYANSNGLDHNENERISYTPVESRLSGISIAQNELNRPSSLPSTPTADKEQVPTDASDSIKNGAAGSTEGNCLSNGTPADSSVVLNERYVNGELSHDGLRSQCITNWPEMELIPRNYEQTRFLDGYSDDDDELEDEQIENEPPPTSKRTRPPRSQASVFSVNHLFRNSSQTLHSLRYALGGILFVAALISLLMTFMTGATSASPPCGRYTYGWYSIEEMIRPHLTLRHNGRPPI